MVYLVSSIEIVGFVVEVRFWVWQVYFDRVEGKRQFASLVLNCKNYCQSRIRNLFRS